MAAVALIDTDILIDVARSRVASVQRLEHLEEEGPLGISVITQMEMLVGCRNKRELQALEGFLGRFLVLPLHPGIGVAAVELLEV